MSRRHPPLRGAGQRLRGTGVPTPLAASARLGQPRRPSCDTPPRQGDPSEDRLCHSRNRASHADTRPVRVGKETSGISTRRGPAGRTFASTARTCATAISGSATVRQSGRRGRPFLVALAIRVPQIASTSAGINAFTNVFRIERKRSGSARSRCSVMSEDRSIELESTVIAVISFSRTTQGLLKDHAVAVLV